MMQDVKRNIKQMENNLKRLESVFKSAEAKGTAIPTEVKDKLKEARSALEAMKSAQSAEAMQAIDMGALNETMQSLEQSRQDIIDSAQRMNDMKRGVKSIESGLKAFESQIAKLVKQKIVIPAETTENLNKVKAIILAVKNAKTMAEMEAAGAEDLQAAMQNLDESRGQLEMLARQADFFGQMEETMQYQRVIMTMSNLGGFTSSFKKVITQAQSQIRKLKVQKLNSGGAEVMLNDINNKGKEISVMLKAKPINEDDITLALEDMDALNQAFNDEISALTGVEDIMPWEQGPQQFKQPQMPNNWQQLMPQQSQPQSCNCQPCNCPSQNCQQSY